MFFRKQHCFKDKSLYSYIKYGHLFKMVFDFQDSSYGPAVLKQIYRQPATNGTFLKVFASTLLFALQPFLSHCQQKPLRSFLEARHRNPVVQILGANLLGCSSKLGSKVRISGFYPQYTPLQVGSNLYTLVD